MLIIIYVIECNLRPVLLHKITSPHNNYQKWEFDTCTLVFTVFSLSQFRWSGVCVCLPSVLSRTLLLDSRKLLEVRLSGLLET